MTSQVARRYRGREVYTTICVSLYPEDLHLLDALVVKHGIASRSALIRAAIAALEDE